MDFVQDPATYVVVLLLMLPVARIAYVLYTQKQERSIGMTQEAALRKHKTRLK